LLAIRLAEANDARLDEEHLFSREYLVARPLLRALEPPGPRPAVVLVPARVRRCTPAAAGTGASWPAAGGAADRRDRPCRRRLRGVPARAAGRGGGDDPGAGDDPRGGPAGDRADLQPH